MPIEEVHRKLAELHEYVRHVFNLFFGWFTFFATVNYATMGWLAKAEAATPQNSSLVAVVTALFISQNLLGIAACFVVRKYLVSTNRRVLELEQQAQLVAGQQNSPGLSSSSLPIEPYSQVIALIAVALAIIVGAWCVVWRVA